MDVRVLWPPRDLPRWRLGLKRVLRWGGAAAALLLLALGTGCAGVTAVDEAADADPIAHGKIRH